jgi:hypothetical protein
MRPGRTWFEIGPWVGELVTQFALPPFIVAVGIWAYLSREGNVRLVGLAWPFAIFGVVAIGGTILFGVCHFRLKRLKRESPRNEESENRPPQSHG